MSIYEFIDNFSMSVGSVLTGNKKYFKNSIESKKISEWFDCINLTIPQLNGEDYYPVNVEYEGVNQEAAFRIEQWKGEQYPTIIYHHGAAEGSYNYSFNNILANHKEGINANLIAIQALFNHSNKEFMESIANLSNYTAMLASSVLLVENIIKHIRRISNQKIVVTGTSLGGFVTNLHFTYYDTADIYKPLLAGARIGDVFISSAYAKVTANKGKMNPDKLRQVLNFSTDLQNRNQENLFPLLGKYDQIMKYETQSSDFKLKQVSLIPYGHATGATRFKILRKHILEGLIS